MTDNKLVSMNINESLIKPIVEAQMKQAILDNMGDIKSYMEQLISIALREPCNERGDTHCSNWDKKYTYIDVLINNAIRSAAREAVKEFMEQESKTFKKAFKNYLKQQRTLDTLFEAFMTFANRTMVDNNYKMDINFTQLFE